MSGWPGIFGFTDCFWVHRLFWGSLAVLGLVPATVSPSFHPPIHRLWDCSPGSGFRVPGAVYGLSALRVRFGAGPGCTVAWSIPGPRKTGHFPGGDLGVLRELSGRDPLKSTLGTPNIWNNTPRNGVLFRFNWVKVITVVREVGGGPPKDSRAAAITNRSEQQTVVSGNACRCLGASFPSVFSKRGLRTGVDRLEAGERGDSGCIRPVRMQVGYNLGGRSTQ